MTDHDPLLDELASAHLDGTTSAEEEARVAADPALRARVEELRAVRVAVGEVPAVDPGQRETAIAAALAAVAEPPDGREEPSPTVAPVTSLAAVAARRRSSPTALRLVGVEAAILLLALLVPLVAGLRGGSNDDESAEMSAAEDRAGDATASEEGGVEAAADATTTTSAESSEPVELGSFDDPEALVDAVDRQLAGGGFEASTPRSGPPGTTGADDPCAATAPPGSSTAAATLDGEPVLAVVTTDADGVRTLRIFGSEACKVLVERRL
ncbi:MAG: hypothetical protein ABIP36_03045 [Acidimicrobiales bacterium]